MRIECFSMMPRARKGLWDVERVDLVRQKMTGVLNVRETEFSEARMEYIRIAKPSLSRRKPSRQEGTKKFIAYDRIDNSPTHDEFGRPL